MCAKNDSLPSTRARPKSPSFTVPLRSMKMLAGLMSRCRIFSGREWQSCSASSSWNAMSHTCFSSKRVPHLRCRRISFHRSPRSQNSIIIQILVVSLLITLQNTA